MKRAKQYLGLFLLAGLIFTITSSSANAQNRQRKGTCKFLTEEQQKQATEIKAKYQKDITYLHNKLNELNAQQKTLVQVDNPSLKKLYSNIESKTELKNKLEKTKAKMHIELRSIMTEEQRLIMGSAMGKKQMAKRGMRKGRRGQNMCGTKQGKHHMHKGNCNYGERKGMHRQGDCNSCNKAGHRGMYKKGDCNSCGKMAQKMHSRGHKGNFKHKGNCGTECKMNLTEDQQSAVKALKLEKLKTINPLKNKLNELRAKKHTLMSAEKVSNRDINKIIDQMSELKEDIAKANIKQKIEMRKLLTEEQKAMFNKRMQHRGCRR